MALVIRHLHPVQGPWAQASAPMAILQRPGCGGPPLAQAVGLAARDHQKARTFSAPQPLSCAGWVPARLQDCRCHQPCGCSFQKPQAGDDWARGEIPGSCSCTLAPRQNYWHCHGSRHTRSGYIGPQKQRSTSGQPSLHKSHGHWAAGTARGRHGWAGPHSLPQEDRLQRPRCHSNSQTGSPGTHWAHSAGPGAGGCCGL